jgi:glycosyltransferase involved in cell wall biosynthesis
VKDPHERLRVLHLIVSLGPTNTEFNEHCLPMASAYRISVCSFSPAMVAIPHEIDLYGGNGTFRGFWRVLRSALEDGPYDIVHAHAPRTAILLMMMAIRLGRRMPNAVCTVHNSFTNFRPLARALLYPMFAWFPAIVVCGRSAYVSLPEGLRRLGGRRVTVVKNGVDTERVHRVVVDAPPVEGHGFTVVWVGRLLPRKDPWTAVSAFGSMAMGDDRLLIVGDGDIAPAIRRHIDAAGLGSRVTILGLLEREEVYRWLRASDVYLSTSLGEGLPVAVLEAMACGVPVVLSDISPHREIVDGEGGSLVPASDVRGFAAALRSYRAMLPADRAAIGERGRRIVEDRFSLSAMHRGYVGVYKALLDRRRIDVSG